MKGKTREIAEKIISDFALEVDGKQENTAGKVQEKVSGAKKVPGK